ncbi:MAG: hypothetical protein LIR31_06005 [Bacteroidota bacterium]|nr:hypothetical protein [Bacteroidota bacterium]
MKKTYFAPEAEEIKLHLEQCIAQSGGEGNLDDFGNNDLLDEFTSSAPIFDDVDILF